MMLAYFARPYDDELLSSWMCRCARHLLLNTEQFACALGLRRRSVCGSFGLPNNLDEVAESISRFYSLSGVELVARFTLLPYFTAYMTDDKRARLTDELCSSEGTAIAVSAGITMSSSSRLNERRFCASCVASELVSLGESYWHRSHQLPGVYVCHIHGETLRVSRYRYGDPSAKSHSALPQDEDGALKKVPPPLGIAHEISKLSSELLVRAPAAQTQAEYALKYRSAIASAGLIQHDGRIKSRKIRVQMEELFGTLCLEDMGCTITKTQSWVAMMLMPTYQWRFSTIKHILMQIFTAQLPIPSTLPSGSVLALAVLRGEAFIPTVPLTHDHGIGGRKVHDWDAKDEKLLQLLTLNFNELQASLMPGKSVSKTMLIRKVGCVGPIRARSDMLPKSISFLNENCPPANVKVLRAVGRQDSQGERMVGATQEQPANLEAALSGERPSWATKRTGWGTIGMPEFFANAPDGAYRWLLCKARAELIAQLFSRHARTKFASLPAQQMLEMFYKRISEGNMIFSAEENLWTIGRAGELLGLSEPIKGIEKPVKH